MTSNAEYFARYEAIAAISGRMLMAARAALWNDLVHLQDPSDGYLDQIHPLRNTYAADFVSLLTTNPSE